MTPSDLRIGNIVKLRDTGEIVRVCRLLPKSVQYCKDLGNENDYRYCRYVDIEGVLIYDHWQKIIHRPMTWCGYEDGDEMYLYYYSSWPHKTFRYIHELQNIHYALTGNEIEIDL